MCASPFVQMNSPTTPIEVNAYDRLRLTQSEPDFEGPYRSIVGTKPLSTVRFRKLRSVFIQDLEGITNNSNFLQRTFSVLRDFIRMPTKSPMYSIPEDSGMF